jgi:uncharacterized membrane protein YfcA
VQQVAERTVNRPLRLIAIGTLAGIFSGLFGVGGGAVMVPLLIVWLGYQERQAAATSLAAIACIAALGAFLQSRYGNVNVRDAALVGIPALAGVVFGTWLQQRLPTGTISLLFAAVLVASAVELVLQ